jgi:hypothetical protein
MLFERMEIMKTTTQQEELRQEVESMMNQCIVDSKLFARKPAKKSVSSKRGLDSNGWLALRKGIQPHLEALRGRTLVEWVNFLNNSGVSCNADILRGLSSDYRLWKEPKSQIENASE